MKPLLVPITIVFTSFFYFPFFFTFLPTVNTKMMLAAAGLILLLMRMGMKGQRLVNKDFFLLSLGALGVSFASLLAMTLNGTSDGAYLGYLVTMWVWVGAAYFVVNFMKAVHGYVNVELICFYMITVGVLQCLLAATMDMYAPLKNFVDSFLAGEGFMGKFEGRLYGIGCALDVAGGRFAVLLIMISFLLPRMFRKENYKIYLVLLSLAFCVLAVIGNMIGRTATVGMVLGLVYLSYVVFFSRHVIPDERRKYLVRWFPVCLVAVAAVMTVLYHTNDWWNNYLRFGFEGFFSLVEKGRWEVQSNSMLVEGMVFPDNLRTWIIGDGYMGSMAADPYYMGNLWYGFYMGTDAGYSRFLFYFGLVGLSVFIGFMAKVCQVCMKHTRQYKSMFLFMLMLNLIIWCKVSTDIFLAFAPFLCLDDVETGAEEIKLPA